MTHAEAGTSRGQGGTVGPPRAASGAGPSRTLSVSVPAPRAPLPARDTASGAPSSPSSPRIATAWALKRALAVLEEYGLVPVSLEGQVASLRRHAACALQNPSGKSTDLMTTSLYVENIALPALEHMLQNKYWERTDVPLSGRLKELRVEFKTNSSKALNQLFCAQDTRHLGQDAAKLICPKGLKEATLMVFASPPGEIRYRKRADGTEVVEGSFNLSTLSQVRRTVIVLLS